MMSRISDEAGLSIRYTNHCLRATVATGFKRAGVDDRAIMSVTGHKNVKSLDSYIEGPTDKQRRKLSNTLQGVATANSDLALIENKTESNALATSAQNNSCQLAVSSSLARNPLSDLNIFTNATITGTAIRTPAYTEHARIVQLVIHAVVVRDTRALTATKVETIF
ncbi:Hypothetical predicted protein [Mytilus galloprovincialis]|uniref:Tyr recombinase domain-containing protein n=1 Tax=Mytilus galloprovincialis TaxID=29158 RepID=A0A8B6HN63_MYTGA|nr:Hypothetical predicted protein [Mytilus galloprovincialis]